MKIEIIKHFNTEDPKMQGDYSAVTVYVDGKQVIEYGDYYHDKGEQCAEGFVDGVHAVYVGYVEITHTKVADWEW